MTPAEARRMAAGAVYGYPASHDAGILHWIETGDAEEGFGAAQIVADLRAQLAENAQILDEWRLQYEREAVSASERRHAHARQVEGLTKERDEARAMLAKLCEPDGIVSFGVTRIHELAGGAPDEREWVAQTDATLEEARDLLARARRIGGDRG